MNQMSNNYSFNYKSDDSIFAKRIIKLLAMKHKDIINPNKYNFSNTVKYSCKGYDLIGSSANTRDSRRHFLVSQNFYTVYEIPMKSNKSLKLTGNFLCLFHDEAYGWWFVSFMKHQFIFKNNIIIEKVKYETIGQFEFSYDPVSDNLSYHCTNSSGRICNGVRSKVFDDDNVRKEKAYHTTWNCINKHFGKVRVTPNTKMIK